MGRVYDTSTKLSSVYTAVCAYIHDTAVYTTILNLVYLYCVGRNNTILSGETIIISFHTVKIRWDSDLYLYLFWCTKFSTTTSAAVQIFTC